ncbi:MAG: hypothetical protein V4720_10720 [Pseudomonadota bacterium]
MSDLSLVSPRRTFAWALAAVAATAMPAQAEAWTAPPGCQVFLTVQSKECRVSNHYRCAAEPEGHRWQADFDPEGLQLLTQTDAETVPVQIIDPRAGTHWVMDPVSPMLPTLTGLLTERAAYPDYRMIERKGDVAQVRGFRQRVPESGEVGAPQATVTIDGVTLQAVLFNLDQSGGNGSVQNIRMGTEYLHSEWRLVFAGPEQWSKPGDLSAVRDGDRSPVDFIFPGEPEFGTTHPTEDCELLLSELIHATVPTLIEDSKGLLP